MFFIKVEFMWIMVVFFLMVILKLLFMFIESFGNFNLLIFLISWLCKLWSWVNWVWIFEVEVEWFFMVIKLWICRFLSVVVWCSLVLICLFLNLCFVVLFEMLILSRMLCGCLFVVLIVFIIWGLLIEWI